MFVFLIFKNILDNVSEGCRNIILGNIFGFTSVSVVDILIDKKSVIFKIYSNDILYFYKYEDGYGDNSKEVLDRIIIYKYFISNNKKIDNKLVASLICCRNEYEVYKFIRRFL